MNNALDTVEYFPEIWFKQDSKHYYTNDYKDAYLVCGGRWNNKPWVSGKRISIAPRCSLSGPLFEDESPPVPAQTIIHPVGIRLILQDSDLINEVVRDENIIERWTPASLPKEIPEIHVIVPSASYSWVRQDCQESGFPTEVAAAALYWAYKIAGVTVTPDSVHFEYPEFKYFRLPRPGPTAGRLKDIQDNFPDMWKIVAFTQWPAWTNQNLRFPERVNKLNELGFQVLESDLRFECERAGIRL